MFLDKDTTAFCSHCGFFPCFCKQAIPAVKTTPTQANPPWICPKCGQVYAGWVSGCFDCNQKAKANGSS